MAERETTSIGPDHQNCRGEILFKNKFKPNFAHDVEECQIESFNLSREKDLCYDRPNTAFCYSLWYHARRVNTFLSYFSKPFFDLSQKKIEIFDLGAGTGAVQWGLGLIYQYFRWIGKQIPEIRIINVDSAPLMLYYSKYYLWPEFIKQFAYCSELDTKIEYEVYSWLNPHRLKVNEPWFIASYLFDITDTTEDEKLYREAAHRAFSNLIKSYNPSRILLLTSDQEKKKQLLNDLCKLSIKQNFSSEIIDKPKLILEGILLHTSLLRKQISTELLLKSIEGKRLANSTTWSDGSFTGAILIRKQQSINFSENNDNRAPKMDLYAPRIKVRRDVILNEEQVQAAQNIDRVTIIVGPAGCGKSVVITQRIYNLVVESKFSKDLNILLTTFNKELVGYLAKWIQELLPSDKVTRHGNYFHFENNLQPNIRVMHFDILPTRIGNIKDRSLIFEEALTTIARTAISETKKKHSITTKQYDKVLNPDYIQEEYHRIIYGLQFVKRDEFMTAERKGRPKLLINGKMREVLWDACLEFLNLIEKSGFDSITTRRHKFLKALMNGQIKTQFTHILIDEYQDCTQADYLIFDKLVIDPNKVVLAGDIAQAVHIGNVADIPRIRADEMKNRKHIVLHGSYRLPFRICEAIIALSDSIQDGNKISPYKGAPPGARPIVVYAEDEKQLAIKVADIYNYYKHYGVEEIVILEKNFNLKNELNTLGIPSNTDTILRLKGMEKNCILWCTSTDITHKDETNQFIYTILSRTAGILIITLSPQTLQKYYSIINLLAIEKIILWDESSKSSFLDITNKMQEEPMEEFEEER